MKPLFQGKTISHYRVLEKLGEGGMGEVYKAYDTRLERTVALKFLPLAALGDDSQRARFCSEAQAAAALDHPNICTVYDLEESDGYVFFSMAFVPGESLDEKLKNGPLDLREAIDIAIQVARGLQEAHEKGRVHRDIKSGNILVTPKGEAKITDFGLALLPGRSRITEPGRIVGTAAYMSPEQVLSGPVDQRSDIWSLGAVIYEMLAGRPPFHGDYEVAMAYSILNEAPTPIVDARPEAPPELDALLGKALAKEPEKRYQRAAELVRDLELIRSSLDAGPAAAAARAVVRAQTPDVRRIGLVPRARQIPVAAYAVPVLLALAMALLVFLIWKGVGFFERPLPPAEARKVLVLPFTNEGEGEADAYFADGMTDEIISELTKISGLRVVARDSSFQVRAQDLAQVARSLDVELALEGTARKAGDRVRVTARLIDIPKGQYIWSETYEGDAGSTVSLREEVKAAVAAALQVRLSGLQATSSHRHEPTKEAYDSYLRGLYHWNQVSLGNLRQAAEYFQAAIAADPNYANAYAGLADVYSVLESDVGMTGAQAVARAKQAALKALELDPTLAHAHTVLGLIAQRHEWDWQGAQRHFRLAIEMQPGLARAHHYYAGFLGPIQGNSEGALREIRIARDLDPLSAPVHSAMAVFLYQARRYDEAIELARRTLEFNPEAPVPYRLLGQCHAMKGEFGEAIEAFRKSVDLRGGDPAYVASLAWGYAAAGRRPEALKLLDQVRDDKTLESQAPFEVALVYAALGDVDRAFAWLEQCYALRSASLTRLKVEPACEPLRADSRYRRLLRLMNLDSL